MIYTIKVKDYDSMQNITVGLAKNGYYVTTENVTDENYKSHWEIKYCESSEINKIPVNNGSDWDGDTIGSMEIHNKDNTKGIKCTILPDEKPSVENEKELEVSPSNPYGLKPKNNPDVPPVFNRDTSDNITEPELIFPERNNDQMTVMTSVSGN